LEEKRMLHEIWDAVHRCAPLIHNITNYVTVNDCANILLACGASPIMADDIAEVEEITTLCAGLNINIGTLNSRTIPAMFAAGKKARELGHPVVLDPVGAGASTLRTQTACRLLQEVGITVIRGNISEVKTLALGSGTTKGVDANLADVITEDSLLDAVKFAKSYAEKMNVLVVITGAIDIITDGARAICVRNGDPMMQRVTGMGCQLSALVTACVAANPDMVMEAAAAAVCAMGLCGEKALARMTAQDGNSAFRSYLIDAIYNLTGEELEREARYDFR
jgi:hydroxyethylthiazole kinase